jgi:hypothetical protein
MKLKQSWLLLSNATLIRVKDRHIVICFLYNVQSVVVISVADPNVCDRIRIRIGILALINYHISTFLVCVKVIQT